MILTPKYTGTSSRPLRRLSQLCETEGEACGHACLQKKHVSFGGIGLETGMWQGVVMSYLQDRTSTEFTRTHMHEVRGQRPRNVRGDSSPICCIPSPLHEVK